jgi:membrane associated rhomboid family serine protease
VLFTYLLIGINIAVSMLAFSSMNSSRGGDSFLFIPSEVAKRRNYVGMLLSHFSHADGAHLLFNMVTLYFFGPYVEQGLGVWNMLLIYALAGIVSTVLVYYRHRSDPVYRALGASDSVTGIVFAAIVLEPTMEVGFIFLPIPIPGPIFAIGYIVLSMYLMRRGEGHISHEAHLAGAFTGLLLAGWLSPYGFRPLLQTVQYLLS